MSYRFSINTVQCLLLLVPTSALLGACEAGMMPGSPCDEIDCSFRDLQIEAPLPPQWNVTFRMIGDGTGTQDFVANTDDPVISDLASAELALPYAERTLFPVGPLNRGDGGHNFDAAEQPTFEWNWHLLPGDWTLTDAAEPLCDGNAVLVEQAIDYWVDTVGYFCPAGARVVSVTQIVN